MTSIRRSKTANPYNGPVSREILSKLERLARIAVPGRTRSKKLEQDKCRKDFTAYGNAVTSGIIQTGFT